MAEITKPLTLKELLGNSAVTEAVEEFVKDSADARYVLMLRVDKDGGGFFYAGGRLNLLELHGLRTMVTGVFDREEEVRTEDDG